MHPGVVLGTQSCPFLTPCRRSHNGTKRVIGGDRLRIELAGITAEIVGARSPEKVEMWIAANLELDPADLENLTSLF
jgi:hypothetical protein